MVNYFKEYNINIFEGSPILFNHDFDEGFKHNPHFHDFAELYMYVSGNADYYIDGRVYDLERGDLVLVLPNEIHRPLVRDDVPYDRFYIKISTDCFKNLRDSLSPIWFIDDNSNGLKQGSLLRLKPQEKRDIMYCFNTIDKLHDEAAADFEINAYSLLLKLLSIVGNAIRDKRFAEKSALPPMIESLITSLDENLAFPPTVEATALRFGVSASYLSRVFKRYMGIGYSEYLSAARISQAKKLLSAGATVTEACYDCGFSDCSHFILVFKRQVGMTPSKYKKGGT